MSFFGTHRPALGLALVLGTFLGGCPPGSLDAPERFLDEQLGDGGVECPPGYDVPKDLFAKKCVNLCHDSTEPDGELDLKKTGVSARLIGVASSDDDCAGRLLIDPANPEQSFLIEKLTKSNPQCGEQMPNSKFRATATEIACVKLWVQSLVGSGSDSGAAGSGGATDSGGGG